MSEGQCAAPLPQPDGHGPGQARRGVSGPALYATGEISEAFFDLYDRMIGDVDIPSVLGGVADVVCQDLRAQAASIYLIDRDTRELVSVAVIGNVVQTIRVPIRADSLAGYCALTGRAYVVDDAYGDLTGVDPRLRFDRSWDEASGFRTRDVMCAPAIFKGEVLGVVQVINSLDQPFAKADLRPLRSLSRIIGYALYHARLFDDLASLKRLEKEKAQFMRVMAHELKSPVAAARTLINALGALQTESRQVLDIADRIGGRMDQLLELIGDLLELAKIKSGDPLGEIAVADIVAHTAEVCDEYREQAAAADLGLHVRLPSEEVLVRIDRQGYRLVVSNLVSNAVKYTLEGAAEVTLARDGKWAVLAVKDTGIGIPTEDIPRLFREFFRASNAKKRRLPGSGVGLAGAKQIVERFGGRMELDSVENEGTTFTVRLPLAPEA